MAFDQPETPIQLVKSSKFCTLVLQQNPGPADVDQVVTEIQKLTPDSGPLFIQMQHLIKMEPATQDKLRAVIEDVQKRGIQTSLILIPEPINPILTQAPFSGMRQYQALRQALIDTKIIQPKSLDVDFINPFIFATVKVLKVQAMTDAKPGAPTLRKSEEPLYGDVTGIIGLTSESFSGQIMIQFPSQTYLNIMSKMLGEPFTELTQDIIDGAGELTNMIFGQAKVNLNEKGYGIKTAIPSVVSGKNHNIKSSVETTNVFIPFSSDSGPMAIEVRWTP